MWISEPMPVTTRIISAAGDRAGARTAPASARGDPAEDRLSIAPAPSLTRSPHQRRPRRQTTRSSPGRRRLLRPTSDSRRPKNALTRNPANGSSGISSSIIELVGLESLRRPAAICPVTTSSAVNASGFSVSRWRKSEITSARPTAASAAATVMTKNVMIWPSTVPR